MSYQTDGQREPKGRISNLDGRAELIKCGDTGKWLIAINLDTRSTLNGRLRANRILKYLMLAPIPAGHDANFERGN